MRRAWSPGASRRLLDGPGPAFDPELWKTVTELGWPDVLVTEANRGGGGGLRELSDLAESVGSVTAPVPLAIAAAAGWCEDRRADGITLLLADAAVATAQGVSGVWPLVPYG